MIRKIIFAFFCGVLLMNVKPFKVKSADPLLVDLGFQITPQQWRYNYYEVDRVYRELRESDTDNFLQFCRAMSEEDFYFFCRWVLGYNMIDHPFMIARCYDIQDCNNYTLDLWPRGHLKSSLITQALSVWDVMNNPDLTIAIFSVTGGDARKHLRGIKSILENNKILKDLWPDVLYQNPEKESEKWSILEGLTVRRNVTVKESSISAYSLIEKMPTGSHWDILDFDDLINEQVVNSPEQISKAADAFKSADNLGKYEVQEDGEIVDKTIKRVIGTRYNTGDVYGELLKNPQWTSRVFPAEVDRNGVFQRHGVPIFLSTKTLNEKWDKQGEYIYNSQMGQNPIATSRRGFKIEWFQRYRPADLPDTNKYLLIDPAHKKGRQHDYTAMVVIGLAPDRRYYVLDVVRDRLNLAEKWEAIKRLVQKYDIVNPVGYEKIGSLGDLEFFELEMVKDKFFVTFVELGGNEQKEVRIERLIPLYMQGRYVWPVALPYMDVDGVTHELTNEFIEDEYKTFPYGSHDDVLDICARILDPDMKTYFPVQTERPEPKSEWTPDPLDLRESDTINWMLA